MNKQKQVIMAKMGFEKNRRIVRVYKNQPGHETLGGREYFMRSKGERNWSRYLQFCLDNGVYRDIEYEVDLFVFEGVTRAPVCYRPDFKITDSDGSIFYQEYKTVGNFYGSVNTKFRRMHYQYPKTPMELVLGHIPKRGKKANRLRVARKYTRRIIDASQIFKQTKGLVKYIE